MTSTHIAAAGLLALALAAVVAAVWWAWRTRNEPDPHRPALDDTQEFDAVEVFIDADDSGAQDKAAQLLRDHGFEVLMPPTVGRREVHGMTAAELTETYAAFADIVAENWPDQT